MEHTKEQHPVQASVSASILVDGHTVAPPLDDSSQCVGGDSQTRVLGDLLRQIKPLCSERPEDILRFFDRLGDIHALGLVDDLTFITRVLPLVPLDHYSCLVHVYALGINGQSVRRVFLKIIFRTSYAKS